MEYIGMKYTGIYPDTKGWERLTTISEGIANQMLWDTLPKDTGIMDLPSAFQNKAYVIVNHDEGVIRGSENVVVAVHHHDGQWWLIYKGIAGINEDEMAWYDYVIEAFEQQDERRANA